MAVLALQIPCSLETKHTKFPPTSASPRPYCSSYALQIAAIHLSYAGIKPWMYSVTSIPFISTQWGKIFILHHTQPKYSRLEHTLCPWFLFLVHTLGRTRSNWYRVYQSSGKLKICYVCEATPHPPIIILWICSLGYLAFLWSLLENNIKLKCLLRISERIWQLLVP